MDAWRDKVIADPQLSTGDTLPRVLLNDHLPALLQDFARALCAHQGHAQSAEAQDHREDAAAHGLHRWQQGFDLSELSRELGRLNECVVAALDRCALERADISHATLA